jgi:hypothetical protein
MPASAVSLSDVPDAYFDPTLWASFLDAFGDMGSEEGKAEVLHVLGMTNDGFLEYANEELADRRDAVGERARRRLVGYDLKRLLLTELRRRLVVGELLGSGISPSGERSAIAGELWDDLKFDFVRNTASSKDFNFVRVFVAEAVLRPVDLVAECEQWLRLQRPATKKVLAHAANARFTGLKTRDFDVAYKRVFGRSRGRPSKAT